MSTKHGDLAVSLNWQGLEDELNARGCAIIKGVVSADQCAALADLYPNDDHFRSHIIMRRHGFGEGEYKYFNYPLPDIIADLRGTALPAAGRHSQPLERGDETRRAFPGRTRRLPCALS